MPAQGLSHSPLRSHSWYSGTPHPAQFSFQVVHRTCLRPARVSSSVSPAGWIPSVHTVDLRGGQERALCKGENGAGHVPACLCPCSCVHVTASSQSQSRLRQKSNELLNGTVCSYLMEIYTYMFNAAIWGCICQGKKINYNSLLAWFINFKYLNIRHRPPHSCSGDLQTVGVTCSPYL